MPSFAAICAANAAFKHSVSSPPVAVIVGGTSGIGMGMAQVFARNTSGNSHIVIVGRNRAAAEKILATMPSSAVGSKEFVQCDVTLMKNIERAAEEIRTRHPKINYLVMSPGIMTFNGRDESSEGIDRKMAVHYYARWKFIDALLPALQKAKDAGEQTSVMSVFSAGNGGAIDVEDIGLKTTYSTTKAALVLVSYNDLMMESFAERESRIPFIHACPGFVRTSLLEKSPYSLVRWISTPLLYLTRPFSVSPEECGEYMWHGIYSTATTPGPWRTGTSGEDIKKNRYYGNDVQRRALWEHTIQVMKEALQK